MPSKMENVAFQKFIEQASRRRAAYDGMAPIALVWVPVCSDPTHNHKPEVGGALDLDLAGAPGVMWVPGPTPDDLADILSHAAHGIRWREGASGPQLAEAPTPQNAPLHEKIAALLRRFVQSFTGDVGIDKSIVRHTEAIIAAVKDDQVGVSAVPPDPDAPPATLDAAEKVCRQIARSLESAMPARWGFTLILGAYDAPMATYISSVQRDDSIKMMRSTIDNMQGKGISL